VAHFLTSAWLEGVNRAHLTVDPGPSVTIEQRVVGGPPGTLDRYWVRLHDGVLSMTATAADADVVITLDYPTAEALATRALSVHDALRDGRVRVGGDLAALHRAGSALGAVAATLSPGRPGVTDEE
jgi:hypothetical protein